jgi:hypothetical protein
LSKSDVLRQAAAEYTKIFVSNIVNSLV